MQHETIALDVAVIGGGPAGISTCLELSGRTDTLKVALFESEEELGGIPRTCHLFFGMRDLRRIYTGPTYARRLNDLIRKTSVEIQTQTTVLNIVPGKKGERHTIDVLSPAGPKTYKCRFLVLATGCCEKSLGERLLPSSRPAGIFTTWQLQQIVNIHHLKPGNRALVIGSEDAALSTVMTLKRAGLSIAGMVEENNEIQTYPLVAKALSRLYGFPIFKETSVESIFGVERVEGVALADQGRKTRIRVACDTVVISGRFHPVSQLIDPTSVTRDPSTSGPAVDMNLMTSVSNIFSAGNVLRGGDMHDLCALEGRIVARSILTGMETGESEEIPWVSLQSQPPIRFVVPQKVAPLKTKPLAFPFWFPGVSLQVTRSLKNATLEAWSGNRKIWEKSYPKLIANHRVPLPVTRFRWQEVDFEKGIHLRLNVPGWRS